MKKENIKLEIYQLDNWQIEVNFDKSWETVWLTQKQMWEIFDVSVATINEHLQNIFNSEELDRNSVIRNFLITASDWKKIEIKGLEHFVLCGFCKSTNSILSR